MVYYGLLWFMIIFPSFPKIAPILDLGVQVEVDKAERQERITSPWLDPWLPMGATMVAQ